MTTKRVTKNKLKEILHPEFEANLSHRQIALCVRLSLGVISKYLQRAEAAGLTWPLQQALSDSELVQLLQPPRTVTASLTVAIPDFAEIAREFSRNIVTR